MLLRYIVCVSVKCWGCPCRSQLLCRVKGEWTLINWSSFLSSCLLSFRSKLQKKTSSFSLLSPDGWSLRGVRTNLFHIIHWQLYTFIKTSYTTRHIDTKGWDRGEEPPLNSSSPPSGWWITKRKRRIWLCFSSLFAIQR